jgi:hypothetical protein
MADEERPDGIPGSDTGWKRPTNVVGGEGFAAGTIELPRGTTPRPCFACRFWDHVELPKMISYLKSRGLEQRPDGKLVTPIVKDFPRSVEPNAQVPIKPRESMVLDPTVLGFCRKDTIPTDMLATCEEWDAVKTSSEMQRRL